MGCSITIFAQEDSTDTDDYSLFGDEVAVKRYVTQKVLNLSATKLISIGYEMQAAHTMNVAKGDGAYSQFYRVQQASGPRVQVNFPVVSNDRMIFNIGGQYWGTFYTMQPEGTTSALNPPADYLDRHMLHSLESYHHYLSHLMKKTF
jgi:hypothetical protein